MTEEEKFVFDLEGYLVIKDVLSQQELDDLNALMDRYIDGWDNHPRNDLNKVSSWGQATKDLIDHPKILPYLVELIGPQGPHRPRLRHHHGSRRHPWRSPRRSQPRYRPLVQLPRRPDAQWPERGDLFSRRCQ